jgi:hydrogenase-4 component B
MTLLLASLGVLLAGIVLAVLLASAPKAGLYVAMAAVFAAGLLCAGAALSVLLGGGKAVTETLSWPLPMGAATLTIDALSAWFLLTIALLSIAVSIYSCGYMPFEIGHGSVPAFSAFLCLLVASLYTLVCAGDMVLFLVAWEMMTVSAFFLVSFHDRRAEVRYSAWMYLIATHLGTGLFLLPMFALLAARAGTSFGNFPAALITAEPRWCVVVFALGLLGFGTKAGFVPMHIWLPNAHPAAPTPVSALLSGVVIKTGIYGLIRLLSWLPPLPVSCAMVMLLFGIVSGILGVLYAIAQHDIKRLLAYHSVENIGIIGLGIGMGMLGQSTGQPVLSAIGYAGALLHVLNHALFKGLLFLSAGAVIHSAGSGEMDRLGGLIRKTPVNAALFLVAAVSICGLPPFNGFVSEWLIYGSLFGGAIRLTGGPATMAVLGLVSLAAMGGLALACFAKVFGVVFLGEPRQALEHVHPTPAWMQRGMLIPAGLCVLIGMLPLLVIPLLAPAVKMLSPADFEPALQASIGLAAKLSLFFGLFAVIVAVLIVIRLRVAFRVTAAAPVPTWGCGYAFPTARMQYTASSFGWSLVSSFGRLLWPHRQVRRPEGWFPAPGALATHTPDVAETDIFAPLFRGIGRLVAMIKTLSWSGRPVAGSAAHDERRGPFRAAFESFLDVMRHGSIQIRLSYIVVTLVVVLVVESLMTSPAPAPPRPVPPATIDAGGK